MNVKVNNEIKSSDWDKIEYNRLNYYYKIGFYNAKTNHFEEVARYRNSCTNNGSNYAMLQIWSVLFNYNAFYKQGSNNVCGGYNKPIANLEAILYQLKLDRTDEGGISYPDCCSMDSGINAIKDYLQKQYTVKLFVIQN